MITAHDRARGALLGLAVGDALGTTLEFRRPGSFEPITDLVGGGPFGLAPGQWTDDTAMALCLAESLLDRGKHDAADQMRRYLRWHRAGYLSSTGRCFDIGDTTRNALERFERTGVAVDHTIDERLAANGSLMRLAPVSIRWHLDAELVIERAAESSRPTHPATRPVDACRLLAAMTAALIRGESADAVFAPGWWSGAALHPEIAAIASGSWIDRTPPQIRGTGFCVDALEAAIWSVAGADGFASAVLRAANLGDDADTTAAIAGQLAGARWGAAAIPMTWRSKLTMRTRIESLADGLYSAASAEALPWDFDGELHAYWAEPGLLAGEYPGDPNDGRARAKLQLLVDAGVRTIVDLTETAELLPYSAILDAVAVERDLDLRHVRHPIPDLSVIERDGYAAILGTIDRALGAGNVFVHCWGGIGRTGTVVGLRYRDAGATGAEALDRLERARAGTRKAERASPETDQQRAAIERFGAVS